MLLLSLQVPAGQTAPVCGYARLRGQQVVQSGDELLADAVAPRAPAVRAALVTAGSAPPSEEQVEAAMRSIDAGLRPVQAIVPAEAAVAALAGKVVRESVLVHWLRPGLVTSLLVQSGRVTWSQVREVRAHADTAEWQRAAEAAARSLSLRIRTQLAGSLFLGLPVEVSGREEDACLERIDPLPVFEHLFPGIGPEEVAARPELFGLAFVPAKDSLAPADYREQVAVRRALRPVLLGAALVAAVGLATAAAAWWQASRMAAEHAVRVAQLQQRAARAQAVLPDVSRLEELKHALGLAAAGGAGLRADHFLAGFTERLPRDARLTRIAIRRADALQRSGKAAAGGAPGPSAQAYEVAFELEVPAGRLRAGSDFRQLEAALAALGELHDSRWVDGAAGMAQGLAGAAGAAQGPARLEGRLLVSAANF